MTLNEVIPDESGDLGFDWSKGISRKFVIMLLVCHTPYADQAISKAIERTIKNKLRKGKSKLNSPIELKGAKARLEIKKYFYEHIRNQDWALYALILNKARVEPRLQSKNGKKKLYNFLAHFLLKHFDFSRVETNVELIVDRSKNQVEIVDFNQYLENQLESLLPLNTDLVINHLDSCAHRTLQAADLFCWGVFRKYEHHDRRWYSMYANKIVFETEYLK